MSSPRPISKAGRLFALVLAAGLAACSGSQNTLSPLSAGLQTQSATNALLPSLRTAQPEQVARKRNYLFVAYPKGVNVYHLGGALLRTVPGPIEPTAIAVDAAGKLYVANGTANTVTVYQDKGATLATTVSNGISQPRAIAVDSHAVLYVANASNVTVYKGSSLKIAYTLNIQASAITVDQDDNAYFRTIVNSQPQVLVYARNAKNPKTTITQGIGPTGVLAVDSNETLYVANRSMGSGCTSSNVTEYQSGATSPWVTVTDAICDPTAISFDQGDVLVANYESGTVTLYVPGSNQVGFQQISDLSQPIGVVIDGGGQYVLDQSGLNIFSGFTQKVNTIKVPTNSFDLVQGLEK